MQKLHPQFSALADLAPSGSMRGMARVTLSRLVRHCNHLLRIGEIIDYDGAVNGLQVECRRPVTRVAAAVDASLTTARGAVEARAQLLLVHHGLFWSPQQPWTGPRYRLIRFLIESDLSVYSVHLPLDLHARLGNNAQLARALGWRRLKPFFFERNAYLGVQTLTRLPRTDLRRHLRQVLGRQPILLPGGPTVCRRIGLVTGGAGSQLQRAAEEGVDTFITGEGPHWTFAKSEELGINVFYGGHYATETFGVKALAGHLSEKFGLSWTFIDHPSGL